MTVGTGKDYKDYLVGDVNIPCHLVDLAEPGYEYNVFEFKRDFYRAFNEIISKNKQAILCGGTGLYIEAVLSNYRLDEVPINKDLRSELESYDDEQLAAVLATMKKLHNHTDTDTRERMLRAIEIEKHFCEHKEVEEEQIVPEIIFGLSGDRDFVREKITCRLRDRLENENMIGEVEKLLASGVDSERLKRYGLEYKYITMYILGELSYENMFEKLNIAIHQFSKRQMTWFRRMERHGYNIRWIDCQLDDDTKLRVALEMLGEPAYQK